MRLAYYAGASTAAAAACLLKAFHERPNFYSATVYLSQSNACLLIITNLLFVFACSFLYALQKLLYGPLRPIEIEQLSEKAWYAVLDTLLAMPNFRDDVGGWLLVMFTLLLAGKVWGWIGEGKVEVLEQQPPANPVLFHTRLASSLIISVLFDIMMLDYCIETVMRDPRPGMMVIFTFEFAILSISSSFTLSRYLLNLIGRRIELLQLKKAIEDRKTEIRAERAAARQNDTANGQPAPASPPDEDPIEVDEYELDVPGWEEKRRYLFGLEVFTDFIKLIIYVVFFTVSVTFNGLPMHIMRDVYMTFASFSKRVSDYMAYRKATSDMNTRYPDATTEEIQEDACIVCRESMFAWEQPDAQGQAQPAAQQPAAAAAPARRRDEGLRAKKLPCGHILHLRCLKSWLERQQVCPTCRRPVVAPREATPQAQQGAPGANPAAPPGQQGRPAAPGGGRARILNLGPVRIGFLNGPGDQIANLIRQMQNPQAARAAQDAAQGANQQGPNHLGLQVPYSSGDQQPFTVNGSSTQSQITQIEQRLLQEAHGLGLEQQQLATLMALENELARLRTLQRSVQQTIDSAAQGQSQPALQLPGVPVPGYMQAHPMMQFQQPYVPYAATAFQGNTSQQFGNGHENLPPGMTLPEGWTVMPLQRADGPPVPQTDPNSQVEPTEGSAPPSATANGASSTTVSDLQALQAALGPTDENGSPYFVPTGSAANDSSSVVSQGSTSQPAPRVDTPSESANQTDNKTPWHSDGWSFVDPPNGHTPEEASSEQKPANGGPPESEAASYTGKGKARAAEVEDVPDSGG